MSAGCKAGPLAKIFAALIDNGVTVQAALKFEIGVAAEAELIYCPLLMFTQLLFCILACETLAALCTFLGAAVYIEFVVSNIFFA